MASSGRISVLVSKELQTLLSAVQQLPKEVAANVRKFTKANALPIWSESVRGHVQTRLQTRVLSDTARVAVSDSNVTLKAGGVGSLSSGTKVATVATATEFGNAPSTEIPKRGEMRSKNGKSYRRRMGNVFGLPRSRGYVVYPAARESIPRLASLWVQTTVRTIHESFEKGGAK